MEVRPHVSPDGRWLAYLSDESGRLGGVRAWAGAWCRPATRVDQRRGRLGGAPDGRPCISPASRTAQVDVARTTTAALAVGPPARMSGSSRYLGEFDVSPDGTRFAMLQPGPSPRAIGLELVQNALSAVPGAR